MGAKPSSAVQQSAYLEALNDYIDYYEDGTLRKCLLDEHGNRLRDAEGNPKTLRHKFAVYCDDICAGADTLEELYELFEATRWLSLFREQKEAQRQGTGSLATKRWATLSLLLPLCLLQQNQKDLQRETGTTLFPASKMKMVAASQMAAKR
jgi:hypothetical protein